MHYRVMEGNRRCQVEVPDFVVGFVVDMAANMEAGKRLVVGLMEAD